LARSPLGSSHDFGGTSQVRNLKEIAMSLQARLDAFKADFEAGKPPYNVPPSVIEIMHRATAELIASAPPSAQGKPARSLPTSR
jgi:hypothetical protein